MHEKRMLNIDGVGGMVSGISAAKGSQNWKRGHLARLLGSHRACLGHDMWEYY